MFDIFMVMLPAFIFTIIFTILNLIFIAISVFSTIANNVILNNILIVPFVNL